MRYLISARAKAGGVGQEIYQRQVSLKEYHRGFSQGRRIVRKRRNRESQLAVTSRRQSERLAIELAVLIRVTKSGKVSVEKTQTLDLSRGGASVLARKSYQTGMTVHLDFPELQSLPKGLRELPARVVRVSMLKPGRQKAVALRFEDLELANLMFSELLRVRTRVSSALLGVFKALTPGAEMATVIEDICWAAERAMEAEKALLFTRDRQGNTLTAHIPILGDFEEARIALGDGLVGKAAQEEEVCNVPNLGADPRFRPELEKYFDKRTHSVLCVPLSEEDGISPGVLVVANKRYGDFTSEDESLGKAVASQISLILRETRLFENIRNLKNYYERILESVATGIVTFDRFGNLTTINRAGSEIFGFRIGPDYAKGFKTLFGGEANARLATLTEDLLTHHRGRKVYDARFLRDDETNLSLDVDALPMQDSQGNFLGGVLVAEDITQEQRLMNTLCRYMAREVAEQVLQHKGKGPLGGTRMEVTVLLTDIRNFTTISEQLDPWDIVELLNAYFPRIINVIFRHQGMVDKFIGDSILAVFGVPVPREDDALRAVRAAVEIRKHLAAINKERARKKLMAVEMGIGITSGTVISGNIGSERRMDYTVIGDPVNLAARLEGLTKEVKRRILVNESVYSAIHQEIPCDALGKFAVKGKREKVPVFAVRTLEEDL
jgi:adenylate cyclase